MKPAICICLAWIMGTALLGMTGPSAASPADEEPIVVPVSIVILDFQTGEVHDCSDPTGLSLRGTFSCSLHDPRQLVVDKSSSGNPIGWEETIVYGDSITKTCGYYRAQLGHVACSVSFDGGRRVNSIWLYHCQCTSDQQEYLTSGTPHNYLQGGCAGCFSGMYETFRENRQVGVGVAACNSYTMNGGGGFTGASGTIGPSSNSACEANPYGVWGIGVNYQKSYWGGDRNVQSSHNYKFTYGTGG